MNKLLNKLPLAAMLGLAAMAGPMPRRADEHEANIAWAKDLRINGPRAATPLPAPKRKASKTKKARRRMQSAGRKAARK